MIDLLITRDQTSANHKSLSFIFSFGPLRIKETIYIQSNRKRDPMRYYTSNIQLKGLTLIKMYKVHEKNYKENLSILEEIYLKNI